MCGDTTNVQANSSPLAQKDVTKGKQESLAIDNSSKVQQSSAADGQPSIPPEYESDTYGTAKPQFEYVKISNPKLDYTFDVKLGEGSFGEVWSGHDINNPTKKVAAKIFKYVEYFNDEVDILHSLKDVCKQYILCYIDSYKYEEEGYIITELLDGFVTLEYWIKNIAKSSDCNTIKIIITQLVLGLEYIHKNGYTHRDIKPDNIMLKVSTPNIEVKYIDFGLACSEIQSGCSSKYGTAGYIPPISKISDDGKETKQDRIYRDYWALGSTLMDIFFEYNILCVLFFEQLPCMSVSPNGAEMSIGNKTIVLENINLRKIIEMIYRAVENKDLMVFCGYIMYLSRIDIKLYLNIFKNIDMKYSSLVDILGRKNELRRFNKNNTKTCYGDLLEYVERYVLPLFGGNDRDPILTIPK